MFKPYVSFKTLKALHSLSWSAFRGRTGETSCLKFPEKSRHVELELENITIAVISPLDSSCGLPVYQVISCLLAHFYFHMNSGE